MIWAPERRTGDHLCWGIRTNLSIQVRHGLACDGWTHFRHRRIDTACRTVSVKSNQFPAFGRRLPCMIHGGRCIPATGSRHHHFAANASGAAGSPSGASGASNPVRRRRLHGRLSRGWIRRRKPHGPSSRGWSWPRSSTTSAARAKCRATRAGSFTRSGAPFQLAALRVCRTVFPHPAPQPGGGRSRGRDSRSRH